MLTNTKNTFIKQTLAVILVSSFLLSGCIITSFSPFYKKTDLVTNDALYGEWIGQKSILTFESSGDLGYLVNYKDCKDPYNAPDDYSTCTVADFTAHLMKLGDNLYLDLRPRSYLNSDNIFLGFHVKPAHSLAQVTIEKSYLEVRLISYSWMAAYLEKNKNELDHIKIDEVVTLTASTSELQEFILKHQKEPGFFDDPIVLKRK